MIIQTFFERAKEYFFDVVLFGVFATALVKHITDRMKYIVIQLETNNKLTSAMCANALKNECESFIRLGHCSIPDRERITLLFENYKKSGGNGVIEDLYNKLLELPIIKDRQSEK